MPANLSLIPGITIETLLESAPMQLNIRADYRLECRP